MLTQDKSFTDEWLDFYFCITNTAPYYWNAVSYFELLLKLSPSKGHSHIESSHSLRQNDATLQTHPPSNLNVKMLNMPKTIIKFKNLKTKFKNYNKKTLKTKIKFN